MQMQEGIGRGGYRVLATVFVGLGLLGLFTSFYAFKSGDARGGFFDWLGIGLSLAALACLYGLVLIGMQRPAPPPRPAATGLPQVFEVHVEEDAVGPETAVPAEPPAPRVTLPPNRNIGMDTKGWPQRHGPSGMTRGEWRAQQGQPPQAQHAQQSPRVTPVSRAPYARGPASSLAALEPEAPPPSQLDDPGVPVVIARIGEPGDNPAWSPKGMARGRCSGCGSLLLAPPDRPIRLRCPKCSKEQLLR
jgi:hypothetical protein